MSVDDLTAITDLEPGNLLIFAAVGFAACSLGFVLQLQILVIEHSWDNNDEEPPVDLVGMIGSIPAKGFIRIGGAFLCAIFFILCSTILPSYDEAYPLFKDIKAVLFGLGMLIVFGSVWTAVFLVFLHTVIYRIFDSRQARRLRHGRQGRQSSPTPPAPPSP